MSQSSPHKSLALELLDWYENRKRDLPWRTTRDPYRIWVSEIMLQQTQVQSVIPYYQRFIEAYPDVESLAAAPLDDVLKAWENLGYYARARNLHRAARLVAAEHDGRIPDAYVDFRALPGVGDYVAGAVLSIAFDQKHPAVDGNVRRVVSRLFRIEEPVDQTPTQRRIRGIVLELIPSEAPGDFNQALMELGATVCAPRGPVCADCPLDRRCLALAQGRQAELPVKTKKKPIPVREAVAAVVQDDSGRFLVVRRPDRGLLGGLWTWPGGERREGESLELGLRRAAVESLGIEIEPSRALGVVRRQYTHFRLELHVYRCRSASSPGGRPDLRWASRAELDGLALSKADREVLRLIDG